jgi:hypothetical protein
MPAINVARTDTFEQQRVKINNIGSQVFNITQGGSDLATGNLKLGDGTKTIPSLGFTSDISLGLYKPSNATIGFVASSKILADIGISGLISYKNFIVQQNKLFDAGTSLLSAGSGYDAGSFTDISLTGGSGDNGTVDVTVDEFGGSITNNGANYTPGAYSSILLSGGSGSGATVSFNVDGLGGGTVVGGSAYAPANYTNVPLTGGSGTGARADINVVGTFDLTGSITNSGTGYSDSTDVTVPLLNVPAQTFVLTTVVNPGSPPPDNVYQVDGSTQATITWTVGNTYRIDTSDASLVGHPLVFDDGTFQGLNSTDFYITQKGTYGSADSFIEIIVKPTATVSNSYTYDCLAHPGMGGTISVVTGTAGQYGNGYQAAVSSSSGAVNSFNPVEQASLNGYQIGDQLTFYTPDLGQGATGSGCIFTVSGISTAGAVTSVQIVNEGQDYLKDDILSANNSDLGGTGNGFTYTVVTDPGTIKDLQFFSKGTGYATADILTLPTGLSNVATIIPGQKTGVSTTLSIATTQITVASTTGIVAGMSVTGDQIDVGQLAQSTTVASVDSATTLTLSANPVADGSATLSFTSPEINQLTVADTSSVSVGDAIEVASGSGILDVGTTVSNIVDATTLEFTPVAVQAGSASINILPPFGSGTTPFNYVVGDLGVISAFTINNGGNGYSIGDVLGVSPTDLTNNINRVVTSNTVIQLNFAVGSQPASGSIAVGDTVEDPLAAQSLPVEVVDVSTSGSFITSVSIVGGSFADGDSLIESTTPGNVYTIDTVVNLSHRFFIDGVITPDLTLYVGSNYFFDLSDPSLDTHFFGLSTFADGVWDKVENISTTLDTASTTITVASTTGISVGMSVTVNSGTGTLLSTTLVESINGNNIVLSQNPLTSGNVVLTFAGTEFTESVTRTSDGLLIKVLSTTPATLYYYCEYHQDMSGADGAEALITVDPNNPKSFGSGLQISAIDIQSSDVITANSDTGEVVSNTITTTEFTSVNATVSNTLNCDNIDGEQISVNTIVSSTGLSVNTSSKSTFNGDLGVGTDITLTTGGNVTANGTIRSNASFNSNGKLLITNNIIESTNGNDVVINPFGSRLAKVNSDTALVIPVGSTLQRPTTLAVNGSIRFNTDTNQYEGYNSSSTSWSSLGGVRDIDGNTYILAELTAGANDNTLWFYNDNVNTIKVTPEFLDFRGVKKISSGRLGLPAFTLWTSNTPVSIGQYLKYRNNLYEVTGAGTTATSGSEPTHTSGIANNGTAQLTWYSSSVSPLEFTEVEELRVGPNKDCPLIVSAETKILDNVISTLVQDLVLTPNSGKKVSIDAPTSLVIPVGNTNQRGSASQGSIRYNTTISQFEGYSGSNWSSLGGVRDVDGNTYIIPETAPAANENILYFYNNNVNTIQLSETELDFTNIDTITTSGGNSLALNTDILTLDSSATTIDNSRADTTFISTSKQYFDLGLSSGLNVDPVLRLDDQGDVYLNTGFGTGTFNGVKIFDGDLKDFELADYAVATKTFDLTKGSTNTSSTVLYSIAAAKGCDVTIVCKSSSGKKSMAKYSVIDDGTDIYFTEIGSLNTSADGFTASFDITALNETRINLTLSDDHSNGDVVSFTLVTQTIK